MRSAPLCLIVKSPFIFQDQKYIKTRLAVDAQLLAVESPQQALGLGLSGLGPNARSCGIDDSG